MQLSGSTDLFQMGFLSALVIIVVLLGFNIVSVVIMLRRSRGRDLSFRLDSVDKDLDRCERSLRDEIAKNREEATLVARQGREETGNTLRSFGDSLQTSMTNIAGLQKEQLDIFSERLSKLTETNEQKLGAARETLEQRLTLLQSENSKKLDQLREESNSSSRILKDEVSAGLKNFNDSVLKGMSGMSSLQKEQMEAFSVRLARLTESNENRLEALRNAIDGKLKQIQEDNSKQLEQMRATVDEKLQGTLEKRLGESFKQVSERLEQVHKGLGEMQSLAAGVGDLKRVLTNVKTRGVWGEIQLETLFEQMLTPEQFERNVQTKENPRRRWNSPSGCREEVKETAARSYGFQLTQNSRSKTTRGWLRPRIIPTPQPLNRRRKCSPPQ